MDRLRLTLLLLPGLLALGATASESDVFEAQPQTRAPLLVRPESLSELWRMADDGRLAADAMTRTEQRAQPGCVAFRFTIESDGSVARLQPIFGFPDDGLMSFAMRSYENARFEPGPENAARVAVMTAVTFNFLDRETHPEVFAQVDALCNQAVEAYWQNLDQEAAPESPGPDSPATGDPAN